MKHMNKNHLPWVPNFTTSSNVFIKWLFRHMIFCLSSTSWADSDLSHLMTLFLTQQCISSYGHVSNAQIQNICVCTSWGICRNAAMQVDEPCHKGIDHFFLFFSFLPCSLEPNQFELISLKPFFTASSSSHFSFARERLMSVGQKIIFFITSINHTGMMTAT